MLKSICRLSSGLLLLANFAGAPLQADSLTKDIEIDFGRDVASRNLKGLATRSDGRVLPGPVFADLTGPKLGDILWVLRSSGENRFLVGTGPDGKVQEVTLNPKDLSYTVREVADVTETQAIAVHALKNGRLLVGTSPTAAIYLVDKDGKNIARIPLPADSVFDFLAQADGTVLAATGNPGKIYQLDLAKIEKAGLLEGKAGDEKLLADKGVTIFGEVRDRNVRRVTRLEDGRVIAGSSPKGNIYSFAAKGGAPTILQENRDAEVVDLLPADDGGFYAAIVTTPGDSSRISTRPETKSDVKEKEEAKPLFSGRSTVVRFPADGFPETISSRSNVALYRLGRHQNWLLLTAGEMGDALGYDPEARRSLTFAGSASAQLNDLAALGNGRFLLLRNNAPGLAVMTFADTSVRELETKRIDLGQASQFGGLRFARLRGIEATALKLQVQANNGSDELEGWTEWSDMKFRDGAYYADDVRGRYAKFRLQIAANAPNDFQIDKATLFHLPQNRRPTLTDFRVFSPHVGIIPAPESVPSVSTTLSQLLFPSSRDNKDDTDKRKSSLMNSQIVPQLGQQLIYWAVNDADGDELRYTFSIRPEAGGTWNDLAVNISEAFVQFDTTNLPEGLYLTRLSVSEQAPRAVKDRLTYAFETDNLIIDRTPPKITATKISRADGKLFISVEGIDALSQLEGAEFLLNNGHRETVTHPVDGILDGQKETFVTEIDDAKATGATSVEILLYDRMTNNSSVRLPLK
ncbi:hypothetical protein [Oleiharenicola lentus]|uniref:hypothetical protein n=1 Tax=Oleiharenicola lentus TaxID=2508720 RepID=UPI003F67F4A5